MTKQEARIGYWESRSKKSPGFWPFEYPKFQFLPEIYCISRSIWSFWVFPYQMGNHFYGNGDISLKLLYLLIQKVFGDLIEICDIRCFFQKILSFDYVWRCAINWKIEILWSLSICMVSKPEWELALFRCLWLVLTEIVKFIIQALKRHVQRGVWIKRSKYFEIYQRQWSRWNRIVGEK